MEKNHANKGKETFGARQYGETKNMRHEKQNDNYKRAQLRNWHTGMPQEILLVDWNDLERYLGNPNAGSNSYHDQFRDAATSNEPPQELKKDVRDALKLFSPIQQRILFRVIVQGQSFEVATARMRSSAGTWRHWYSTVAAPLLREKLADYQDSFRVKTDKQEVA